MTLDYSSGITYTSTFPITHSPLLDLSYTGGASSANPSVYSYAFEFTEDEANDMNFPELSVDQALTCYMSTGLVSSVQGSDDMTLSSVLFEQTGTFTGSGSSPANETSISGATGLTGKNTILTLLAWFGLIALH